MIADAGGPVPKEKHSLNSNATKFREMFAMN